MKKEDFIYETDKHERFFYSQLSERGKRLYAGLEAMKAGYYGVREISQKFDIHIHTVRRGKNDLLQKVVPATKKFAKRAEAGKKTALISNLLEVLLLVLNTYTAGNPMCDNILWTNLTFKQIQEKLKVYCMEVSCLLIKRLLKTYFL